MRKTIKIAIIRSPEELRNGRQEEMIIRVDAFCFLKETKKKQKLSSLATHLYNMSRTELEKYNPANCRNNDSVLAIFIRWISVTLHQCNVNHLLSPRAGQKWLPADVVDKGVDSSSSYVGFQTLVLIVRVSFAD